MIAGSAGCRSCTPCTQPKIESPTAGSFALRVGINQPASPAAVKRLPVSFRLREAIGERIQSERIHPQAEVTAADLDVFNATAGFFYAALPRHHTIGAAIDGRCRYGWCGSQRLAGDRDTWMIAVDPREHPPGVGGLWRSGEGAAERHHAAHRCRGTFGQFTCINAAQTPAHQAYFSTVLLRERLNTRQCPIKHCGARTDIASLLPPLYLVTKCS